MERVEAEAIYDRGRDAVVEVLLALSAQNERLEGQVERLTARVDKLERELAKNSRNSSQPPSADRPGSPSRRGKDPSGRKQGAQPGHEGSGRQLLATSAVDEVIVHWPGRCDCGHEFVEHELVGVGRPVRHQVEEAALAQRLSELARDERWWPTVARLRCFHGIDTLTAFALHLELGGDWQRFARAPALAAWLGLTPTLSQSGESSRQGHITKTGSTLARRLLVEAAWHYARTPGPATALTARQAGQPAHVLQIAHRSRQRLHRVHRKMRARGKPGNVCVVAAARELSCFLWAAATTD